MYDWQCDCLRAFNVCNTCEKLFRATQWRSTEAVVARLHRVPAAHAPTCRGVEFEPGCEVFVGLGDVDPPHATPRDSGV